MAEGLQPGALQLRGMLPARVAAAAQNQQAPAAAGKPKPAAARDAAAPAAPKAPPVDDKW